MSSKDTTHNTSRNPFSWVEEIEICNGGGDGSDEYGRYVMVMTVLLVMVEEGGGGGNGVAGVGEILIMIGRILWWWRWQC